MGNRELNIQNKKGIETHSYATFIFFPKLIYGDYLIIIVSFPSFPFLFRLRRAASFLFPATIKLLGEFKFPPSPHENSVLFFPFLYSDSLKHFSYFKIDRFIYLFIQFVFYPPPVKNTFRINLKFTIQLAPTHFSISAYFTNIHFIFRMKMKFSKEKVPIWSNYLFLKTDFLFLFFSFILE